tara:strand:- start:1213 stop:3603 length:2391 start_codon:yes stop_codon:yes gene_type:complete
MANFSNDVWMASTAAGFYPHSIDQSLRFEDGDSPRLTRTPSSASNRKTWTWSAWIKRGNISTAQFLFQAYDGASSRRSGIKFNSNNTIAFDQGGSASSGLIDTVAVYRDVSSFYHIVVVADYSNGTAGNRAKIYINGVLQTVTTSDDFENADGLINSTNEHSISFTSSSFFDGYMAEVNFIDGSALGPDSFGETKDGIWVPKDVSGLTYGTNGFHLDFADNSTIGNDVSGNDNDFAVSGLVAADVVPDSPTDVYCTWSPVDRYHSGSPVWSEGNTKFRSSASSWTWTAGTIDMIWGTGQKFAFKFKYNGALSGSSFPIPFISSRASLSTNRTDVTPAKGTGTHNALQQEVTNGVSDFVFNKSTGGSTTAHSQFTSGFSVGDAYEYLVDLENETLTVKDEGGTTRLDAFDISFLNDGSSLAIGVGAYNYNNVELVTDFTPSISGYNLLSTASLPEPAIIDASEYFNSVVYTGNGTAIGSGGISVTGVNFSPSFVWIKSRTNGYDHMLFDSVRGPLKILKSNSAADEITSNTENLVSFNSDGFTYGSENSGNEIDDSHVAWNWKAGTAVSGNTTGSGTAKAYSGSVSAESGFSIIKYVGNGTSGHTIPHNLGAVPTMIIAKNLDQADDWAVYHNAIGSGNYLKLNTTAASTSAAQVWNDTTPSNSVFSVGSNHQTNATNENYIAYCFTDIDQYCKAGAYNGNSSSDGTYVHTGFAVSWLMVKSTSSGTQWMIYDNKRLGYNVDNNALTADDTATEKTDNDVDLLSNGFKWRRSSPNFNQSTYIYLAFAEQPAKFSNAR